jgi:hypothetical protein
MSVAKLTRVEEKRIAEIATMFWLTEDKPYDTKVFKLPFNRKIELLSNMAKEFGMERIEQLYLWAKENDKIGEITCESKYLFNILHRFDEFVEYHKAKNQSDKSIDESDIDTHY